MFLHQKSKYNDYINKERYIMRVEPNFDTKKWCVYNETTFELELKEDAPQDVKEKYEKWKEAYEQEII